MSFKLLNLFFTRRLKHPYHKYSAIVSALSTLNIYFNPHSSFLLQCLAKSVEQGRVGDKGITKGIRRKTVGTTLKEVCGKTTLSLKENLGNLFYHNDENT